ncbi:MAG: cell division protein FtsL [Burkholderiales bacterium]
MRLNLLLLVVLVCCALSVVTSQHQARKAFIDLQSEKDREAKLDQEWRELQIESQTLGTHKRIEQRASRELSMTLPDPKRTVMVTLDRSAKSSTSWAAPPASAPAGAAK